MPAKLWLLRTARASAPKQDFVCRICHARLNHSEYAFHVKRCYQRNEAELRSASLREQAPNLLGDGGVDTEFIEWHKTRGTA